MKKFEGRVQRVNDGKLTVALANESTTLEFPTSLLPDVTAGSTLSINIKVKDQGSLARQNETVELFTALLDNSCPKE